MGFGWVCFGFDVDCFNCLVAKLGVVASKTHLIWHGKCRRGRTSDDRRIRALVRTDRAGWHEV